MYNRDKPKGYRNVSFIFLPLNRTLPHDNLFTADESAVNCIEPDRVRWTIQGGRNGKKYRALRANQRSKATIFLTVVVVGSSPT